MRVEHLEGSPFAGGYRSDRVRDVWLVGEVRTVPRDVGEYLVATFPEAFVETRSGKRVPRAPELPTEFPVELRARIDGFVAKAPEEARPALAAAVLSVAQTVPSLTEAEIEAGSTEEARVTRARRWVALGAPVEAAAELEGVDPALLTPEPITRTAPDYGVDPALVQPSVASDGPKE